MRMPRKARLSQMFATTTSPRMMRTTPTPSRIAHTDEPLTRISLPCIARTSVRSTAPAIGPVPILSLPGDGGHHARERVA